MENWKAQVHIRLEKKAGEEDYTIVLQSEEAWMLLQGIAILIVKCAQKLGYGIDEMLARLATVLLAPRKEEGK